jgi:hypothetical protein
LGSQKGSSLLGDLRVSNHKTVEKGAGTKLHFSSFVPLDEDEDPPSPCNGAGTENDSPRPISLHRLQKMHIGGVTWKRLEQRGVPVIYTGDSGAVKIVLDEAGWNWRAATKT